MKEKNIAELYLTEEENKVLYVVFMGLTVSGSILVLLWIAVFFGIGFFGFPLLFIGAGGLMFLHSSRVTDEDYEKEVKRIIVRNGIEENDTTLTEYIIGKSEHIKMGRDKRIRSAYCSVAVFLFKKGECVVKKYIVDILNENVISSEYKAPIGCSYEISEKEYSTSIGEIKRHFLTLNNDPETTIPVNINVYDTDAVIKRITHKR